MHHQIGYPMNTMSYSLQFAGAVLVGEMSHSASFLCARLTRLPSVFPFRSAEAYGVTGVISNRLAFNSSAMISATALVLPVAE